MVLRDTGTKIHTDIKIGRNGVSEDFVLSILIYNEIGKRGGSFATQRMPHNRTQDWTVKGQERNIFSIGLIDGWSDGVRVFMLFLFFSCQYLCVYRWCCCFN